MASGNPAPGHPNPRPVNPGVKSAQTAGSPRKPCGHAVDVHAVFGRKPKPAPAASAPAEGQPGQRAVQIKEWSRSAKHPRSGKDQRGYGRIHVANLQCRLGVVTDLSARGLGVVGKGKQDMQVGDVSVMALECHINHEAISAWVICVNRTVLGRRKIRYGLRIIDKTRDTRDKLTRLMSLTRKDGVQFFLDAS